MNEPFTIEREGEASGALVLRQGGRPAGRLDFHADAALIEIDYVVVDPSLRGRGFGVRLVDEAVNWARETNRRVLPLCGFAASVLRSDPRYADVLAPRG